jgi:hypothetical protein
MLKELSLKLFLICCSIGIHNSGCSLNVPLREEVAQGGGRGDVGGRLSRNVKMGSGMGEHGPESRLGRVVWCLGKRAR